MCYAAGNESSIFPGGMASRAIKIAPIIYEAYIYLVQTSIYKFLLWKTGKIYVTMYLSVITQEHPFSTEHVWQQLMKSCQLACVKRTVSIWANCYVGVHLLIFMQIINDWVNLSLVDRCAFLGKHNYSITWLHITVSRYIISILV